MKLHDLEVGDSVRFAELHEMTPYKVMVVSDRYAICTKPYNFKKTVIYTIIDFDKEWRGPNDYVFNPFDFKVQEDIDNCLSELENGKCSISRRNGIELNILEIISKRRTC